MIGDRVPHGRAGVSYEGFQFINDDEIKEAIPPSG